MLIFIQSDEDIYISPNELKFIDEPGFFEDYEIKRDMNYDEVNYDRG
jgi:hypothetical protein